MTYDVAIIGAGVTGALTARRLSAYKLKICILEKGADVAVGATKANSAIVHGGYDPVPGTLKAKLNVEGAQMMEGICRELDVHYKNNGSMVVAFDEEQLENVKKLYARGIENGVKCLSVITGDEARALEPKLSKDIVGALLCKSSGIVCPYELTIAAAGNAMDNGAELKCGFDVESISDDGETFTVRSSDGQEVCARYIVDAAGIESGIISAMLGEPYTINTVKGEYMLLDKSEGSTVSHTIFQTPTKAGKGILVSPTVDGNLLTGPTSQACEPDDKTTTLEGLDTVKAKAALSVPSVNFRSVITSFTGLRASCRENSDFIIKNAEKHPRAVLAVAVDSPGLSSSPAIAEYITGLLCNAGLALEKNEKYSPYRVSCRHFRSLSDEEKNEIIKKDPSYGRVVCRCETVTEGEILMAIRQNPPATTMDGIKRRTRAGMGRCQAGFCTPFTTELIARELGIAESEVTKNGGNSKLLIGKKK